MVQLPHSCAQDNENEISFSSHTIVTSRLLSLLTDLYREFSCRLSRCLGVLKNRTALHCPSSRHIHRDTCLVSYGYRPPERTHGAGPVDSRLFTTIWHWYAGRTLKPPCALWELVDSFYYSIRVRRMHFTLCDRRVFPIATMKIFSLFPSAFAVGSIVSPVARQFFKTA